MKSSLVTSRCWAVVPANQSKFQPAAGAVLFLMGALVSACSSDETGGVNAEPEQPGATVNTPAPAQPGAPAAPGMTATPMGGATTPPATSEGTEPGNVDTSMLPGSTEPPAGNGQSPSNGMQTGAGGAPAGEPGTGGAAPEPEPEPEPEPAGDCPTTVLAAGDSTRTLTVGNVTRTYVLHVPNTYTGDARVPLLFDFHGLGGNGQQQRNGSSFVAATQSDSAILAFPSGTSDGSGNGWNVGTCCASGDDVAFTRAMVTDISGLACIDSKRIYATGFSNGGGMSYKLACEAADIFAAVAPASFDLAEDNVDDCQPSRPISIVAQRGTNDFAVPFEGGPTPVTNRIVFLGAQATFDTWSELNGCTAAAQAIGNNCTQITGCEEGTENTLCVIQGGGHQPGVASTLWPILREYTLP
jgi:polyhydroxybutyrate depolymerase